MKNLRDLPRSIWRLMKGPILLYRIGLGHIVGTIVLLLTTTGRKTGIARVTPLQYEKIDGDYYVGAVRGKKADWIRNILADPNVKIQVKTDH
ncbi:MAG: nitroreductase/quinone reductase family protein, partial [Candidatus Hodarchaeota archaeon]